MREARRLAEGPGFRVDTVVCRDDHHGWSAPEESHGHRVVLVRRGRFRRVSEGRTAVLDATVGYLAGPGEEERFAHPAGGDVCTSVHLAPALWRTLAGEAPAPGTVLYVDARLDLAHRRVLTAARSGDPGYALTESLLPLMASARPGPGSPAGPGRLPRRGLVDAAREAIACDHPAAGALFSLAALLSVSPYQLSRAFTRELGVSLTHYRNRVRVGRALDRLERGAPSLAALAAELGFADQAHLTRTVRRHTGHTPAALRRLLSPGGP